MDLANQSLVNAFHIAYNVRNNGKFESSNSRRSSKFVFEVAKQLKECSPTESEVKVQRVDDFGNKESGEWLFDICILEVDPVKEDKRQHKPTNIARRIIWAVESEYDVSTEAFVNDFGKLLVVKADNVLYLNGLNQDDVSLESYIEKRKNTAKKILSDKTRSLNFENMYLGFWPSPEKSRYPKSLWDSYTEEKLKARIQLFKWGNHSHDFDKIDNKNLNR